MAQNDSNENVLELLKGYMDQRLQQIAAYQEARDKEWQQHIQEMRDSIAELKRHVAPQERAQQQQNVVQQQVLLPQQQVQQQQPTAMLPQQAPQMLLPQPYTGSGSLQVVQPVNHGVPYYYNTPRGNRAGWRKRVFWDMVGEMYGSPYRQPPYALPPPPPQPTLMMSTPYAHNMYAGPPQIQSASQGENIIRPPGNHTETRTQNFPMEHVEGGRSVN